MTSSLERGEFAGTDRKLEIEAHDTGATLRLSGDWTIDSRQITDTELQRVLQELRPSAPLHFDTRDLNRWDSTLLAFLNKIVAFCGDRHIPVELEGLPAGVETLLQLLSAVPERQEVRRIVRDQGFLESIGIRTIAVWRQAVSLLGFIGEATLSLHRLFTGRARFRRVDFWQFVEECGARALPIVTLISLLVGMILAFVGAHQLAMFGAEIYIAGAVGIGMVREMGAMMTGIILAGRTGAAYAAQLGSMQVNQEIDALTTMGFNALDFLVLPRMLALVLMTPILCIYADVVGILGGALVGVGMYEISAQEFLNELQKFVHFDDIAVGLVKGGIFGILVALSGCLRGMECGRSSSAVGLAATSAVVTAIVLIVVADTIITVVTTILKF
ncbi:MAG TPA: MlaE family lipid ABC transporter permease subunit [Methylococcus sp.]|nr:MlaE family lipid ABC transporter permease subunit [Methylococcus sp.]